MTSRFVLGKEVEREQLDWGELGWISRPPSTGSQEITVIEVTLKPGKGHNFHKHPDQEELVVSQSAGGSLWPHQLHRYAPTPSAAPPRCFPLPLVPSSA